MPTRALVHVHQSGRFDRSPASLAASIRGHIDAGALLHTLTEVSAERREQGLRDVAREHDWGLVTGDKGGMDDCAILWSKTIFRCVAKGTAPLADRRVAGLGGGRTAAAWAVLDVAESGRLLVVVAHMPRAVEGPVGFRAHSAWVSKWKADHRALKRLWNRLAREHNASAILVTADWNINIRRRVVQAIFKALQPGMRPTLNYRAMPTCGTHGNRIIDFSFIRGRIRVVRPPAVSPSDPSSDHRAFRQVFRLLPRRSR